MGFDFDLAEEEEEVLHFSFLLGLVIVGFSGGGGGQHPRHVEADAITISRLFYLSCAHINKLKLEKRRGDELRGTNESERSHIISYPSASPSAFPYHLMNEEL